MKINAEQTRAVVDRAIEAGVNLFDTADIYGNRGGSEEMLGQALGPRRHDVIVATKFAMAMSDNPHHRGGSRRWIMQAVDASLRRLGTDYLDLYQIHFPDDSTPQEETLRALDDLVRAGKVRYLGSSNFAAWQVADSAWIARTSHLTPYVSAQNQYNLLDREIERELVPACVKFGVGILPYFPLASGFLTGKYRRGEEAPAGTRFALMKPMATRVMTETNFAMLAKLEDFAHAHGHTMLELAVGWLATKPYVSSVISGATTPDQVTDNVKAVDWKLTPDEISEVDKISRPRSA
jgi:aryl-alcohol dehydrogenase-like predicted oxidoreductase